MRRRDVARRRQVKGLEELVKTVPETRQRRIAW